MKRGPDFIVIGAMKCATSTLHEQLALQPGVFMSTPKEPNFFSDDEQYKRGAEWYADLFASADDDAIAGESSTHYTKLPTHPHTVDRLAEAVTDATKFIYVMRHPFDRMISHYTHEWTQAIISCPLDEAMDRHPEIIAYSQYAMQLAPYIERFGAQRILPVWFNELAQHPQPALERIGAFLGLPEPARWVDDLERQNVSSQRLRKSKVRTVLMEAPGSQFIRRRFIPQALRDRVKRRWMPAKRPECSDATRAEVEAIFDKDLARLGTWLGVDLNCENFAQHAVTAPPPWTGEVGR